MTEPTAKPRDDTAAPNFIADILDEDLRTGKHQGRIATRFPPEPNGRLHIGHAKAICINFEMAAKSAKGSCNLRFDDTNPVAEDEEFVQAIQDDVRWLGFDWGDRLFFASDYFEQLYEYAIKLIQKGKAYVDDQPLEVIREQRGSFYKKGVESPHRNRPAEESLDLFRRMRAGEFADGSHVLRAKIDMQSGNLNMRDPLMYRIRRVPHHRTGDSWCIYPMYDYAHPVSDAIEGITHSLCSLEFENHRPLYDWFVRELEFDPAPRQIEFARLHLTHTVLSKRKFIKLVELGKVSGWDDPRMPTLSGLRRRGYTPEAIRAFCNRIGVAKRDGVVDIALLEHAQREDLNARCPRVMAVLNPLKLVIENLPEDYSDTFEAINHPEHPERGTRLIPFSREIYIEREDFAEVPAKKWFRLAPGSEVRLRYACLITCKRVIKDATGNITELRCEWDPDSRGGMPKDGRKVKGTLHWVSAKHAVPAEIRLYDRLFRSEFPDNEEQGNFLDHVNEDSLTIVNRAMLEPSLLEANVGERYQFERLGYFTVDTDSSRDKLVFNRTLELRDTWSKVAAKG